MTRVVVIDPYTETISERELLPSNDSHAEDFREIIGNWIELAVFQAKKDDVINYLYVDEEGLLCRENHFFSVGDWGTQAYAGIGVIAGCDHDGGGVTVSSNLTVEEVRAKVSFLGELTCRVM